MVDARNFLLNSDYPMDQIVGFMSGSMTVANGVLDSVDTSHGLSFTPLPVGSWSYQAAFDTSYPTVVDYNGNGARPSVKVQANGSVLRVTVNNNTGSSKTIYWRVFFLLPSTVDPDVSSTALSSIPLTFNSDNNYTKLLSEGYVTSTTTVSHGLGYRPQIAAWGQYGTGFVEEVELSDARAPITEAIEVTTTDLIITMGGTYVGTHYRIYGDAA